MASKTKRARPPASPAASAANAERRGPDAAESNGHRAHDPDGGAGEIHDQLIAAVAETARLLEADGAMVYLVDPATGDLRFAHDAGIRSPRSRAWVRSIRLPVGTGMFGQAVATRGVVVTDDYLEDPAFDHAVDTDRVVADIGIRSMVAAPLVNGDEVFGAIGAFSSRTAAFNTSNIALVRALADHAAAAMANARLIEQLDHSRAKLAARADVERSLREIAGRISAASDLPAVLQGAVDEAARLLAADGARIDLIDPTTKLLAGAYVSGENRPEEEDWPADPDASLEEGVSGQAVIRASAFWTGDYLGDRSFPHGPAGDAFVTRTGIRSVMAAPLIGEGGPFGALTIFTRRGSAWDDADALLLEAIAAQAAITITTARLIDELGRSRVQLAQTAEAERTLREIAGRVSAMRDQGEILQSVIEAAARLLQASGVTIDLIDKQGMAEAWLNPEVRTLTHANVDLLADVEIDPDMGVSGLAIRTKATAWTGEYLEDQRFGHTPDRDAFVRESEIHSVLAAPLIHRDEVFGVVNAYSDRTDAFDETDAGLLAALADQAAIAIANARLIEELERSRAEIARRADSERTLREIAARVSAILEPDEVLQQITEEAARLLESDGARIDQYDPEIDALRWSYAAGDAMSRMPNWAKTGGLKPGQAVAGMAFAEQRGVLTTDYLTDERFDHTRPIDSFIKRMRIRAVMSTPLFGADGPIGTISVVSRSAGHYDESDLEVLTALATQASIAIRNARLVDQLARSRSVIERRAEAEHALREIAARITAIRQPGDLLQHVVDEAQRLLRGDGAIIDEYDPETQTLEWAYDAGIPEAQREAVKLTSLHLGEGASGKAVAERRVLRVGDYLEGDFVHDDLADSLASGAGLRDFIAAPIIGESGPLGAIEVFSRRPYAFDEIDEAVLGGLADQAAIAITNARLIEELENSRLAVARRADTERSLRDITARIAALRELDVILDRVVEEAARLLGTDGAHLTRMSDDGTYLVPVVVAGGADFATQAWLLGMRFPMGGGINGLAAASGEPVSTFDYLVDPRIPHDPDDTQVADRLALRGMAAAPLRAPGGEVIGTLAVSSVQPRAFQAEELDLLQGLADQAAIAITNSNLLTRLASSEERYRYLVENAPDLVWSVDSEGRFTFLSDAVERLTGRAAEVFLGQHFGSLVHESSRDVAEVDWAADMTGGTQELRARVNLLGADGEPVPAEFIAMASLDEDGAFVGANGSVRDMRDRDLLERGLRRQAGEIAAGEERAHLARELHDSVTQALFSMTLVARSVELLLDRDPDAARAQLIQLRELQREALAEMRALIFELRPGNLEQDGLVRALKTHTASLQGRIGLPVVVESTLEERLPLPVEETLYRIAQEALHNVVKHAGAREVRVELQRTPAAVRLRIVDDGKGFDPTQVPDGHLGLAGMQARAARIGATFSCRSEIGKGTTIEVVVEDAAMVAPDAHVGPVPTGSIRDR